MYIPRILLQEEDAGQTSESADIYFGVPIAKPYTFLGSHFGMRNAKFLRSTSQGQPPFLEIPPTDTRDARLFRLFSYGFCARKNNGKKNTTPQTPTTFHLLIVVIK